VALGDQPAASCLYRPELVPWPGPGGRVRPTAGSAVLPGGSYDGRNEGLARVRDGHAVFDPLPGRPDPIGLLEEQAKSRVPELAPSRPASAGPTSSTRPPPGSRPPTPTRPSATIGLSSTPSPQDGPPPNPTRDIGAGSPGERAGEGNAGIPGQPGAGGGRERRTSAEHTITSRAGHCPGQFGRGPRQAPV
jgi:hypothetical protein